MFNPTEEEIQKAIDIISTKTPHAVGYRVLIKPLPWANKLSAGTAAMAPTLAKLGFEDKSTAQAAKESKGTQFAIVCHVGKEAYNTKELGREPWVKERDVVVFNRYAGPRMEFPPESKVFYQICNDEDFVGAYEDNI